MQTLTAEEYARAMWHLWGSAWAKFTRCSGCGEQRHCRGRRHSRLLCLECYDQGGG